VDIRKKFSLALAALTGLAILSWLTLSNDPVTLHDTVLGFDVHIQFRTATLAVLGLFAALTMVSFWRESREQRRGGEPRE